ncbi:MAG: DUF167 domain-containing protein [Alphaproteobacteria bacterium]
MGRSGPIGPAKDGVTVAVRLTPRAKTQAIHRAIVDGPSGPALKASVAAPPVEGAANAALLALLAKTWRLPKSALEIVGGAHDRNKLVLVRGDPAELMERIARWRAEGEDR